jgi:IS1 family transposase
LVEGNSIRATARMVGVAKRTVSNLLRDVGAHCKNYHDRFVTGVETNQVQADEIWSFVGCKEKQVPKEQKRQGRGDLWTFTAICRDSKLLIAYQVGNRDGENTLAFMDDLAERVAGRIQLTTDGHPMYQTAVELAFGWGRVDYAQLEKQYRNSPEGARRYSPPVCTGSKKKALMGNPDPDMASTSHVERKNLTMRMSMRRFTRLTNAGSKKIDYHLLAVALHTMSYNYVKPHGTLTKAAGGVKTTPAMAAGLAARPWTVEDLLGLLRLD